MMEIIDKIISRATEVYCKDIRGSARCRNAVGRYHASSPLAQLVRALH